MGSTRATTGIVDQNVETREALDRLGDHRSCLHNAGEVSLDNEALAAVSLDFLEYFAGRCFIAAVSLAGLIGDNGRRPQVGPERSEVRSTLGAGGFGAVYLGHDTKLDRPVAIKVLRAAARSRMNRPCRRRGGSPNCVTPALWPSTT
jgi:hypothetical protein